MASEKYGMTSAGFIPKRLIDIQADINNAIATIIDPKTGEFPFQNIEDDTILQQIVGIFAAELQIAWQAAYDASTQFNPLYNTGAGQAGTVQLNAIARKAGTRSIIKVECRGVPGVIIEKGRRIGPFSGETEWAINDNIIFPPSVSGESTAIAYATCTEYGANNPEQGTINTIQTPVSGWLGVSNITTESIGTDQETDETLRKRQQQSTATTSYRQIDAIRAAILNVEGVVYCRVYQNTSAFPTDERGIPFKEVAAVVVGGDPKAIVEAMALRMPTGQIGYGSTSETLFDAQGFAYAYSFSRPDEIEVYVNVIIQVANDSEFPSNTAIENIKNAIVNYSQDISENRGFQPGENVVRTRLYTPVNTVPGHRIISVKIGTEADELFHNDISIAWNQASKFDVSRITVVVQA